MDRDQNLEKPPKVPLPAAKDKKMKAFLQKNQMLQTEMKQRLTDYGEYFNTEKAGYLDVDSDNERERTLKVKQDELKGMLAV